MDMQRERERAHIRRKIKVENKLQGQTIFAEDISLRPDTGAFQIIYLTKRLPNMMKDL